MCYIMKNIQISVILLRFYAFFRLFCSVLEPIWMKKYHKIQKSREKQNGFSTVFFESTRQQDNKTTSLQGKVQQSRIEHRGYMLIDNIQLHIHNYQLLTINYYL